MMGDLVRSFAAPLTHEMLHRWHRSLLASRAEMEDLGRYRTGDSPNASGLRPRPLTSSAF